MHLHCYE